jgi:MFS family permease
MWGVGTLVGPAAGGFFAQFGSWRWAFGVLAVLTVAMVALVPFALPARADDADVAVIRIPVWSLLLLGSSALAVSIAGIPRNVAWTIALLVVGAVGVAAFILVDRRTSAAVLPPTAFRPGPLKWIYVTLGLLMAATMADMYVPFFGQRLAHLTPLAAGFLGVSLAVGWTLSEIFSASATSQRTIVRLVVFAPLLMALGLGLAAASMAEDAPVGVIVVWVAALATTGVGVGVAWPHLSAWAMGCVDDPSEGPTAAAAINTIQLICGAFGAGLAGVVVNMTDHGDATPARAVFAVFAVLAVVGLVASYRASRDQTT